jgi:hypothetical protein
MNSSLRSFTLAPVLVALACGGGGGRDSAGASDASPSLTTTVTGGGETTGAPTTSAGSSGGGTSGGSGGQSTGAVVGSSGGPDPKFDLGTLPDAGMGCGDGGGGGVEFSHIWVANSGEGTISKINTVTLVEEGRYIVRPDSAGSPSRTSVNLAGDVAVANRYGGVTKVFARVMDCKDTNGTPGIQTSTGKDDVLPWGVEECVAWYAPSDFTTQRPLAWSPGQLNLGTCKYEGMQVWTTGGQNNQSGSVVVYALNGETGAVEATIPVPELQIGYFGPYGAAFDTEGNFWFVDSGNDGPTQELVRVTTSDNTYDIWTTPAIHPYGFTVDTKGRPWIAGYSGGIARFDPISETFEVNAAVTGLGIQEDAAGRMWVARYPWVQPETIFALDRESMQLLKEFTLPSTNIKGISIDFYGKVWAVDQGTSAFRVDPESGLFDTYQGLTGPYTYSDMTGWGLSSVTNPQG